METWHAIAWNTATMNREAAEAIELATFLTTFLAPNRSEYG
jgi:hypothetical protein